MENILPIIFYVVIALFLLAIVALQIVMLSNMKKLKSQMASLLSARAVESRQAVVSQGNGVGTVVPQNNKQTTAKGQVICPKCYLAVPMDEKKCPHCASPMGRR